jgi:hypothetical protein
MARSTGHISLIAKGPLKSVRRAAQRHGIHLESCRVVSSKFGDLQCYAPCSMKVNHKVVEWYTARAHAKTGRGYPPGTLLYHGAFCETKNLGKRARKRHR